MLTPLRQLLLALLLLTPLFGYAASIDIHAQVPFPGTVMTGTIQQATYIITNITPDQTFLVKDISQYPADSGLTTLSTTCDQPLAPLATCLLVLQLHAPMNAYNLVTQIQFQVGSTQEVVSKDILVTIAARYHQYLITGSAGVNGAVIPNTPQLVNLGDSVNLQAIPDTNYSVDSWLVDGQIAQKSGNFFTLTNVSADHTVNVTFKAGNTGVVAVVGEDYLNQKPIIISSVDGAETWDIKTIAGLPTFGSFNTASCTGSNATAVCIAAGQSRQTYRFPPQSFLKKTPQEDTCEGDKALLAASGDGSQTWTVKNIDGVAINSQFLHSTCKGNGASALCVVVGSAPPGHSLIAVSRDGANTWALKTIANFPYGENVNSVLVASYCSGGTSTDTCLAVGKLVNQLDGSSKPLLVVSHDGGENWQVNPIGFYKTLNPSSHEDVIYGQLNTVQCMQGGGVLNCFIFGHRLVDDHLSMLGYLSQDGGYTWRQLNDHTSTDWYDSTCVTENVTSPVCIVVGRQGDQYVINHIVNPAAPMSIIDYGLNEPYQGVSCAAGPTCLRFSKHNLNEFGPIPQSSKKSGIKSTLKYDPNHSRIFNASRYFQNSNKLINVIAGGFQLPFTSLPKFYLFVNTDVGTNSWVQVDVPNLPAKGEFKAIGATK